MDNRAIGVQVVRGGQIELLFGDNVIVSSGAFHSPKLRCCPASGPASSFSGSASMSSPTGPVGANLQDHPLISVSAYLPRIAREKHVIRRNYSYLRYSSGIEGCEPADMIMMAVCQSMWHAVGERIGTLSTLFRCRIRAAPFALAPPIRPPRR